MLRQGMDAQVHHKLGVIQDDPGDFFFRAGEIMGALPQPQQGVAHRTTPLCLYQMSWGNRLFYWNYIRILYISQYIFLLLVLYSPA